VSDTLLVSRDSSLRSRWNETNIMIDASGSCNCGGVWEMLATGQVVSSLQRYTFRVRRGWDYPQRAVASSTSMSSLGLTMETVLSDSTNESAVAIITMVTAG